MSAGAHRRVVIVGASLAGLNTCEGLRRHGHEGPIVLIGDEPHLPYDRPPLSKDVLTGAKTLDDVTLVSSDRLSELDVELRTGVTVTGLDVAAKVLHAGTETVAYDELVVATGASARPFPGATLDGIHLLRRAEDAVAIADALSRSSHLVVVGGGYIGAEVASAARAVGVAATIVDPMPVMLSRGLGSKLGPAVAQLHRENGVQVRCGVGVEGFKGSDRVEAVATSEGLIDADLVVVGIGAIPNTSWLDGSGVELVDGVVCDAQCRAIGASGVWAAGDVARWFHSGVGETIRLEHWTNAIEQANAVAQGICGDPQPFAPVPYVWSDQHGKRLQCFGSVQVDDEMVIVDGELGPDNFVALFGRADRLVGLVALNGGRAVGAYRRLLVAGASWGDALAA